MRRTGDTAGIATGHFSGDRGKVLLGKKVLAEVKGWDAYTYPDYATDRAAKDEWQPRRPQCWDWVFRGRIENDTRKGLQVLKDVVGGRTPITVRGYSGRRPVFTGTGYASGTVTVDQGGWFSEDFEVICGGEGPTLAAGTKEE